jgi:hypothetical protein
VGPYVLLLPSEAKDHPIFPRNKTKQKLLKGLRKKKILQDRLGFEDSKAKEFEE